MGSGFKKVVQGCKWTQNRKGAKNGYNDENGSRVECDDKCIHTRYFMGIESFICQTYIANSYLLDSDYTQTLRS